MPKSFSMALSHRELGQLVRLLGYLQEHLEAGIDSELLHGETEPRDPDRVPIVAEMREQWRQSEDVRMKLLETLHAHS